MADKQQMEKTPSGNPDIGYLITNISYCGKDIKKIMVTSRYAGEGKSYVTMNLMRSLARLGRRVVVVVLGSAGRHEREAAAGRILRDALDAVSIW